MEKQNFPLFAVPSEDRGLRDLPPAEPDPRSRMEADREDGCGCQQSRCVGYEGCGPDSMGLCEHPLAMVYAPCQYYRALYDPATALGRGTLFTELDLPLGSDEGSFTTLGCGCRYDRRDTAAMGERRRT